MQKLAILGSTGSIGTNTLDVISRFPDRFKVCALSTYSKIGLLLKQIKRFNPDAVSIVDVQCAEEFRKNLGHTRVKVYSGDSGLCNMLSDIKVDMTVVGIVGSQALLPILKSLDTVKKIALANKEALVMAGDIIMQKARDNDVKILPVDSEHNAVFQCIGDNSINEVKTIYLTGSGGPLRSMPRKDFKKVTPARAVNHPKWKMGKKISVDSATLMNKGLEVIEAHHLFGVDVDRIKVLIHPETVVHSMVEFVDGSIIAQMGACDMRLPIQHALTYPDIAPSCMEIQKAPFRALSRKMLDSNRKAALIYLHFLPPDFKKFPCLEIAYAAAKKGMTHPCVLNASNEIVVEEFLKGRLNFTAIPKVIEKVLCLHRSIKNPSLEDILQIDRWARIKTKESLDAIIN